MKHEIRYFMLKGISRSGQQSNLVRNLCKFHRASLFHISTNSKIIARCIISGRATSVMARIQLSRFQFRNVMKSGDWPGFRRAS